MQCLSHELLSFAMKTRIHDVPRSVQWLVCLAKSRITFGPYISTPSVLYRLELIEARSSWTDLADQKIDKKHSFKCVLHIHKRSFLLPNFEQKWKNNGNNACNAMCETVPNYYLPTSVCELLPLLMIVNCVTCQVWKHCYFKEFSNCRLGSKYERWQDKLNQ